MNIEDKLMNELLDVTLKLYKLKDFKKTEKFNNLSEEMQNLLIIQQSTMNTYAYILKSRIDLLKKEGE